MCSEVIRICDAEAPQSVEGLAEVVASKTAVNFCFSDVPNQVFESAEISSRDYLIFAKENERRVAVRTSVKLRSNFGFFHRKLQVHQDFNGIKAGEVAHKLLKVIRAVEAIVLPEGSPKEDFVPTPDLILFYLKEGYFPVETLIDEDAEGWLEGEQMEAYLFDLLKKHILDKELNNKRFIPQKEMCRCPTLMSLSETSKDQAELFLNRLKGGGADGSQIKVGKEKIN